jgi:D-alanine-D-alanine ligase
VVKPGAQGSALGVRFAASRDAVPEALVAAFSYDDRVLLERHVSGRELAVSLLDGEPLPVVEVRPKEEDRFNYEARYEIGRTEYVCPADLASAETTEVQGVATRAYEALGCTGFARVDLMHDADSTPQVLEANAIPGLTDTSLFPMAADAAAISFEDLVARIVELAVARSALATKSR